MAWYFRVISKGEEWLTFNLVDDVNVEEIEKQLESAEAGTIVHVPARMKDQMREAPLYIRPDRWDAWQFFHHDSETIE